MEYRTLAVDQKLRNIQSDFGSADFEKAAMFHDYMMPKIIETAQELGTKDLPVHGEYEQMLVSRYSALYTELISDETTMAEEIKSSYYQTRENYFNTSEGHANYEITRTKQEFEKAKVLFGRPTGETDAVKFLIKNPWLVYIVLVILGLLELPLNQSVFEPLSIGKAGTLMLALLLVSFIPILSHFSGKFIKQHKESNNLMFGIGLLVLLISCTAYLAILRFMYFEAKASLPNFDGFQEAYKAVKIFPHLFSSPIFWTTFLFNLSLVITGFVLGHQSHDSIDAFEKSYVAFTIKRPKLIEKLSGERRNNYTNVSIQGNGALTREQRLLKQMVHLRSEHEVLNRHVENLASYLDGLCKEAINTFRVQNQASRRDLRTVPRHWRDSDPDFVAVEPKSFTPLFVETFSEMEAIEGTKPSKVRSKTQETFS